MIRWKWKSLIFTITALGSALSAPTLFAGAFQLFEQDGGSPGNYHAKYAVNTTDASTSFYNPAGIPKIKNQQAVFAGIGVVTSLKYQGILQVTTLNNNVENQVTAQGGTFSFIPALHYVAPITDYLGFGFSIAVPFGAKTNYGWHTLLRYATTKTTVSVVDYSPALGWQITDKASIGAGFDVQRMHAEFYSVAVLGDNSDSLSTNLFQNTGYGYHLGALYAFNQRTRLGLSYHSQVVHHLRGSSLFQGPIAEIVGGGPYSSSANTKITLPAYTALSIYHQVKPNLAMMASIIYTQWSVFKTLVLNDLSGITDEAELTKTMRLIVPENFRNAFNFSVGSEYNVTDKLIVRTGLGFDQTPVRDRYRNVELPDNNRYLIALGGHYQVSKAIGVDLSWLHIFFDKTHINPPPQPMGPEVVTTIGEVKAGGDLYAAQLTWDIL